MSFTFYEIRERALRREHKGKKGVNSASSLYRSQHCGAWHKWSEYDLPGAAAERGTILHWMVEHNMCPSDSPEDYKSAFTDVRTQITHLHNDGWSLYCQEEYGESDFLTGTCDAIYISDDNFTDGLVVDYCFGNKRADYKWPQIMGYVSLFSKINPKIQNWHGVILQSHHTHWVRSFDVGVCDKLVKNAAENRIYEVEMANPDGCRWCPGKGECKTYTDMENILTQTEELF
jgi:hypothetical protein